MEAPVRKLMVPKGYSKKEEVEKSSWRRIERYEYKSRTIEAYYHEPEGLLVGLKHVCHVRMFSTMIPFYGFYEDIYGNTVVEVYSRLDMESLLKILSAHYGTVSLSDITMTPGSEHNIYTFLFHGPCIVVEVTNHEVCAAGKAIPFNRKPPIDFMHYYD